MITTIIFDWGGVIANRDNVFAAKKLASKYDLNEEVLLKALADYEDEYSVDEHYDGYLKKIKDEFDLSYQEVIDAKNGVAPGGVLELAEKLKANGYPVYIHSDQPKFRADFINENYNLKPFEKVFFSCDIGVIKKYAKAFEIVLSDIAKRAEECLFVDDREINLKIAGGLGMNTILFNDLEQLKQDLEKFEIKYL
jgi:HAD superfamily hydrolase (TIGR01509 family)